MFDLVIKPRKTDPKGCEPVCCPDEKPRYPRLCLEGSAREALAKALGEMPDLDEELILDGVRVRVSGLTRNEWSDEISVEVKSVESVSAVGGDDEEEEPPTREDAMNRAVGRRAKMSNQS